MKVLKKEKNPQIKFNKKCFKKKKLNNKKKPKPQSFKKNKPK